MGVGRSKSLKKHPAVLDAAAAALGAADGFHTFSAETSEERRPPRKVTVASSSRNNAAMEKADGFHTVPAEAGSPRKKKKKKKGKARREGDSDTHANHTRAPSHQPATTSASAQQQSPPQTLPRQSMSPPSPSRKQREQDVGASYSSTSEEEKSEIDPPPPIERWKRGAIIGTGSYGTVSMGMNNDTGELFVVKEVPYSPQDDSESITQLEQEIKLLSQLRHKHIVRYLGTEKDAEASTLRIFLEHMPGGCIADLLKKFGPFDTEVIRKYTKEILHGVIYLHSHHIAHRDIKGQNILVDNTGTCKLADFGCSKLVAGSLASSFKGTPVFMAPEVIQGLEYDGKADIWSLGCTVIQMATGKAPFSEFTNHIAALVHITSTKSPPPIPDGLPTDMLDFLSCCFKIDPIERASAEDLLEHPFLHRQRFDDPTASTDAEPSMSVDVVNEEGSPFTSIPFRAPENSTRVSFDSVEQSTPTSPLTDAESRRAAHSRRKEKWRGFMRNRTHVAPS